MNTQCSYCRASQETRHDRLLCCLLRIRSPEDLRIHAARGAVFETWAISEMLKDCHNQALEPDLYFWRDSAGHEIDLLIDRGGEFLPVEIKSGETIGSDFFASLRFWRRLAGQESGPAALVYGGGESYTRDRVRVTSWAHWG